MFGICLEFYSYICRYFRIFRYCRLVTAVLPASGVFPRGRHICLLVTGVISWFTHNTFNLMITESGSKNAAATWEKRWSIVVHSISSGFFEIFWCAKSRWCGIKCQYRNLLGKLALPTATRQADTRQHFMMVYSHWKQMHHSVWPCLK